MPDVKIIWKITDEYKAMCQFCNEAAYIQIQGKHDECYYCGNYIRLCKEHFRLFKSEIEGIKEEGKDDA